MAQIETVAMSSYQTPPLYQTTYRFVQFTEQHIFLLIYPRSTLAFCPGCMHIYCLVIFNIPAGFGTHDDNYYHPMLAYSLTAKKKLHILHSVFLMVVGMLLT